MPVTAASILLRVNTARHRQSVCLSVCL